MTAFVRHLGVNTQVFRARDCHLDSSHPGPTGHQECAGMMRQVHGLPFAPCLSPVYGMDFWFASLPITFYRFIAAAAAAAAKFSHVRLCATP